MGNMFYSYRPRWIIVGLMLMLGAFATYCLINSLRTRAEVPQVIERIHMLTKILEVYVADHGKFPEDLQTLVAEMHLDQRLLLPIAEEKVEYFPPSIAAPGT